MTYINLSLISYTYIPHLYLTIRLRAIDQYQNNKLYKYHTIHRQNI